MSVRVRLCCAWNSLIIARGKHTLPARGSLRSRFHDPVCGEDFVGEALADVVGVGLDEGVEEGDEVFDWVGEGGGGPLRCCGRHCVVELE